MDPIHLSMCINRRYSSSESQTKKILEGLGLLDVEQYLKSTVSTCVQRYCLYTDSVHLRLVESSYITTKVFVYKHIICNKFVLFILNCDSANHILHKKCRFSFFLFFRIETFLNCATVFILHTAFIVQLLFLCYLLSCQS